MTVRSQVMQRFKDGIVSAVRSGKGIALIVPSESTHELPSLIEMVALQLDTRMPHVIYAPILDLMDSTRGLLIHKADQIPSEHQERLLAWMSNRDDESEPVFAVFSSERRWRYCAQLDQRPPSSQRERVERWSAKLKSEFADRPLSFPELHNRESDMLGILLATIEALHLSPEQTSLVKADAFINALLHEPPATVLLLVNQISDVISGIVQNQLTTAQRAASSLRQPALPDFGD